MNNSTKEQIGCDVICKSHSARNERDLYRICPSKLSKRELEDLYFALLENNLELKKKINVQQDKIKVLSTRLQRMTVQKNVTGKEKDCCASKAVVNEQRESITDLKKANERMAERIRLLNMRLCSAKQFLKRSPSQSTNSYKTCTRCSFKNSSMSALNAKKSDSNMKTTAVSCQFLDKDLPEKKTQTEETETDMEIPEKEGKGKLCNENKCRTMMDELKGKIVNLQEELATSHDEYSKRIDKLESLVSELHDENIRVRSDQVASEHELQQRVKKADELRDRLRNTDATCNELNMELTIEKRKVTELETGLKLANMSKHVVETIEQFTAEKEKNEKPSSELTRVGSRCSTCSQKNDDLIISSSKANMVTQLSSNTKNEAKISMSDDSGCTELNKSCETDDDQALVKMNRELLKKIAELQTQLDMMRIASAGNAVDTKQNKKTKDFESYDVETKDIDETQMENASGSETILINVNTSFEKSKPAIQTAAERDRDSAPDAFDEAEPMAKPWEDYLITGRNENVEETRDNSSDNINQYVEYPLVKDKSEAKVTKDDEHNSFQIPGPIPVTYPSKDKKKSYRVRQNSKEYFKEKLKKKSNPEEKTVTIFESNNESYISDKPSTSGTGGKNKDQAIIANLKEYAKDIEAERKKDIAEKKQKNVSITDEEAKLADRTLTRDSIFVNRKKMLSQNEEGPTMEEVKRESTTSFYIESLCTPPNSNNYGNKVGEVAEQATQVEGNLDMYALCESHATICRCPVLEKRDVAVFRSCSGTLRFRTTAASDKLRRCGCRVQTDSSGTQMEPPTNRRDSATYTAEIPNTYMVNEKQSRATSPDNTDHEISSMTDLPSEKDAKSPQPVPPDKSANAVRRLSPGVLSPGEKATMTCTDSETMPTDYGSLSEGEMPVGKVRRLSAGERPATTEQATNRVPLLATSSEKMEATLQSISEELAKCRQLLLSQRPAEKDSAEMVRPPPREELTVHALHHSAANRRIADTNSPSCAFTLHIGTLVLSDESVMYSRNKSLILTWKFYSQNAAMARVQPGRVVQFDFLTEYNVSFNEDLLDYMKHSDMAIVLCEFDKQDEPFAMCSLPLREALLHANRRADMSLALMSTSNGGPRNSFGDEVGVLDLWCAFRVDVSLLPTIHQVMQTPAHSTSNHMRSLRSDSKVIQEAMEDEVSSDTVFSRYIDMATNKQANATGPRTELSSPKFSVETENQPSIAREQSSRYDEEVQQYRSTKPYRRRSSPTQKAMHASEFGLKGQVGFENQLSAAQQRHESGIIINEVPAPIKSTIDKKEALERNVQQDNTTSYPKMDDDNCQIQSSIGSVKSLAVKHQLSKLRWSKNKSNRDRVDSLHDLLEKNKESSIGFVNSSMPDTMAGYDKDEDSCPTLSKINNISKYIGTPGLNKLVEASKKSVKYNDAPSCEEPPKENSADSNENSTQTIDITILWLALNEECEAMVNSKIERLYVAYSFLGRRGAELETPFSLPKPKHYADKCYFNFKKTFQLHECDLPLLGHMSRCRAGGSASTDPRDCIVFTLISEPPEDPLGLSSCEDVGYAYLYLGDVLAYSGGSNGYTEVIGVHSVHGGVCGVLAVRVDQLPMLRRTLSLSHSYRDLPRDSEPHSSMPTFQPSNSSIGTTLELYLAICDNISSISNIIYQVAVYVKTNLEFYMKLGDLHAHHTRNRNKLKSLSRTLAKSSKLTHIMGPSVYNNLPDSVTMAPNLAGFKRNLKRWFIEQSFYSYEEFIDTKY